MVFLGVTINLPGNVHYNTILQVPTKFIITIFIFSSISTLGTRFFVEKVDPEFTLRLLLLFPIMLLTTFLAKKVLYKISKDLQDKIIIYSLIVSFISIIPLFFK